MSTLRIALTPMALAVALALALAVETSAAGQTGEEKVKTEIKEENEEERLEAEEERWLDSYTEKCAVLGRAIERRVAGDDLELLLEEQVARREIDTAVAGLAPAGCQGQSFRSAVLSDIEDRSAISQSVPARTPAILDPRMALTEEYSWSMQLYWLSYTERRNAASWATFIPGSALAIYAVVGGALYKFGSFVACMETACDRIRGSSLRLSGPV